MRQEGGFARLYRGVTAVAIGAIPSHAVYFGVYEYLRHLFGADRPGHPFLSGLSGASGVMAHDLVITPLDAIKQRMQMCDSPYRNVLHCARMMRNREGLRAFYASYPVTIVMDVPYMALQFATYESIKWALINNTRFYQQHQHENRDHALTPCALSSTNPLHPGPSTSSSAPVPSFSSSSSSSSPQPLRLIDSEAVQHMLAGAGAGALSGLVTTPLDCIKTRIQIRGALLPPLPFAPASGVPHSSPPHHPHVCPPNGTVHQAHNHRLPRSHLLPHHCHHPQYKSGGVEVARLILLKEGFRGFFRGAFPRMLQVIDSCSYFCPSISLP